MDLTAPPPPPPPSILADGSGGKSKAPPPPPPIVSSSGSQVASPSPSPLPSVSSKIENVVHDTFDSSPSSSLPQTSSIPPPSQIKKTVVEAISSLSPSPQPPEKTPIVDSSAAPSASIPILPSLQSTASSPTRYTVKLDHEEVTLKDKIVRGVSKGPDPRLMMFSELILICFWYFVWPPMIQNPFVAPILVLSMLGTSTLAIFWTRLRPNSVPSWSPKVSPTRADIEYEKWNEKKTVRFETTLQRKEANLTELNRRYYYLQKVLSELKDDEKAIDSKLNEFLIQADIDVIEPDLEVEKAKIRRLIENMVTHSNTSYPERSMIVREKQLLGRTIHLSDKLKKVEEKTTKAEFREHQSTLDSGAADAVATQNSSFFKRTKPQKDSAVMSPAEVNSQPAVNSPA